MFCSIELGKKFLENNGVYLAHKMVLFPVSLFFGLFNNKVYLFNFRKKQNCFFTRDLHNVCVKFNFRKVYFVNQNLKMPKFKI